ncbi:MAG: ABC transporter ATP-binding protein [Patescibacteria group bacterium]
MVALSLVQLTDLDKSYGSGSTETVVLKRLNLNINRGEFVAIMGPSGSGKSTLMHILGLLDRPTHGAYYLAEERVDSLSEDALANLRNRRMGFVFQSFNLLPRTSALENVELPLIYAGVPAKERHTRAVQALERIGLGHRINNAPNQLSGGEQQRVAIARALVCNPEIIFADEPTGNLDTKNSWEIMEVFKQLNQEGHTVVLVTHEDDIAGFAKRIIRLKDGVIVSDEVRG